MKIDGADALALARNKSIDYGEKTGEISQISREARAIADKLESQAEFYLKSAKDAEDAATKAYDLARSAIDQKRNIRFLSLQNTKILFL